MQIISGGNSKFLQKVRERRWKRFQSSTGNHFSNGGKDGNCSISDAWTRLEPELTIEGKTLLCEKGEERKSVSLICRDNRSARRYNRAEEIYPEPLTANLLLDESLAHESAYLRFRCYF